ncbi:hypothetical protein F4777DRAFT_23299 [Nemania sp. FL0916]|nr:hypothetical protein F4777DRAFT_23299 [Nemania sp. FL0916]
MEPTHRRATATPKRRSCDRCHGQKLRCIREGSDETAPCNRCLRQAAECVYSSSLPKGRPSMYKQAETTGVSASCVPNTARRASRNSGQNGPPAIDNIISGQAYAGSGDAALTVPTNIPVPAWAWLDSLDWNDFRINGTEFNWTQETPDTDAGEDPKGDSGLLFTDGHQNMLGGLASGGDGSLGLEDEPLAPNSFSNRRHGSESGPTVDRNGHHGSIAELSQLSTILSPLHRSSLALAERQSATGQLHSQETGSTSQFINSPSFELVAEWIVRVSAGVDASSPPGIDRQDSHERSPTAETTEMGVMLHRAFSATRELLEILRRSSVNTVSASSGIHPDFSANVAIQPSSVPTTTASGSASCFNARASGQFDNSVIRHLVIACHTMLLGTYARLLKMLQHDADRFSTTLPRPPSALPHDNNPDAEVASTALTDIRLVMVVQLCSYLTERQCQAVDLYLSPQLSLIEPSSFHQEADMMRDLRLEVQNCLRHLQQALGL